MEYKGQLYGKLGKTYFPMEATSDDFDRNIEENAILTNELQKYKTLFYQETTRADLLQEQKESDSVEFAEWMSLNAQPRTTSKSQWRNNKTGVVETTQELYHQFKQSK